MGNLAGVFETLQKAKPGPKCGVAAILETFDAEDAAELVKVLANHNITSATIERALVTYGFNVSRATIANHRRSGAGGCRCNA